MSLREAYRASQVSLLKPDSQWGFDICFSHCQRREKQFLNPHTFHRLLVSQILDRYVESHYGQGAKNEELAGVL